jgi:hypothetical protein
MRISAAGVWLFCCGAGRISRGYVVEGHRSSGAACPARATKNGLSRPGNKESCYQQAEDESAHVGEERDPAAVRLGVEQPEVPSTSW